MWSVSLQADKRAHHNALERKRRDHIKDSFHGLRDSVPALQGEKVRRTFNHFLFYVKVKKRNQCFFKLRIFNLFHMKC